MSTFLVVGASGKTGTRVSARLAESHTVRAASRSGDIPFDWADPSGHDEALDGVDGVFLTIPGQDPQGPDRMAAMLRTAGEMGVRVAVLLSARAVDFHPQGALAGVEAAVRQGPLAHAILRPSWFAQNFTEGVLQPDAHGVVRAPTGEGREPFIDLDDVADVAVAALTGERVRGTVSLSGSEALSFGEAVRRLGDAQGRHLRFEAVDPTAYRAELAREMPAEYVAWRMAMFDAIRDGRDAFLSSGVPDALGRQAHAFSTWVKADQGSADRGRDGVTNV
jgi:uncharacterized protein YbjT (DUF2867 family)